MLLYKKLLLLDSKPPDRPTSSELSFRIVRVRSLRFVHPSPVSSLLSSSSRRRMPAQGPLTYQDFIDKYKWELDDGVVPLEYTYRPDPRKGRRVLVEIFGPIELLGCEEPTNLSDRPSVVCPYNCEMCFDCCKEQSAKCHYGLGCAVGDRGCVHTDSARFMWPHVRLLSEEIGPEKKRVVTFSRVTSVAIQKIIHTVAPGGAARITFSSTKWQCEIVCHNTEKLLAQELINMRLLWLPLHY